MTKTRDLADLGGGFIQVGATVNMQRTVEEKLQDVVSVKDFGADPTGATDSTAAIQAAIDSFTVSGGTLSFPKGSYKISNTLTVAKPVILKGEGCGDIETTLLGVTSEPATKLLWAGGYLPMINYGGFGAPFSGGGIQDLALDGASTAEKCLNIKDLHRADFSRITLANAIAVAWYITNTAGQFPTGFFTSTDVRISLRGGSTNGAHGLHIDGVTSGNDGVTLCTFTRLRIEHANGHGVLIGAGDPAKVCAGDGLIFNGLHTYRDNAEIGSGVYFAQIHKDSICTHNTFYHCLTSGGFTFATPGTNYGNTVLQAHDIDLNSGTKLINGAGAIDVVVKTNANAGSARGLLSNPRCEEVNDGMYFVRHDATNSILHTVNHNWNAISTAGTTYGNGSGIAGTLLMSSGGTANDMAGIYGPLQSVFVNANNSVLLSTGNYFNDTSAIKVRIGFFDGVASAAPSNGLYVEFDDSVNSNFRLVSRVGGVETAVVTTLAPAAGYIEWLIYFTNSAAVFNYRAQGFIKEANAGIITTNLPVSTLMGFGVTCETTNNTNAVHALSHFKYGANLAGYHYP